MPHSTPTRLLASLALISLASATSALRAQVTDVELPGSGAPLIQEVPSGTTLTVETGPLRPQGEEDNAVWSTGELRHYSFEGHRLLSLILQRQALNGKRAKFRVAVALAADEGEDTWGNLVLTLQDLQTEQPLLRFPLRMKIDEGKNNAFDGQFEMPREVFDRVFAREDGSGTVKVTLSVAPRD